MPRYGANEGLMLVTAASAVTNITQSVDGASIAVSADIDFMAVNPFFTASATDLGITAEFRFVGQMIDGVTFDTNPMIVRIVIGKNGYVKGPRDLLPVKGYRKVRLIEVRNNSLTKTLSGINVHYRLMKM